MIQIFNAWRAVKKLICDPVYGNWNIFILSLYTFISIISSTIIKNATKNWGAAEDCMSYSDDRDSAFLSSTIFEVAVSFGGFFLPVVFYKIRPEKISIILQLFDLIYIFQFMYPIRVVIRIFQVIQGWCLIAKKIVDVTLMAESSTHETTIRNLGILLIVADITQIFANQLLVRFFLDDTPKCTIYFFLTACILFNTFGIFCLTPCTPTQPQATMVEIFTMSLDLMKTQEIWLYLYFFIYLGAQNVFNHVIYPTLIPTQKFCLVTLENQLAFLFMSIGSMTGSFLIIYLSKKYKNTQSVIIGLVINLITYMAIYLKTPRKSRLLDLFVSQRTDLFMEALFPFLLGVAETCTETELILLLSSVYTQEICAIYAIYELIQKVIEKVITAIHQHFPLLTLFLTLSVFGVIGTITILVAYKKDFTTPKEQPRITVSEMGPEDNLSQTSNSKNRRKNKYYDE